MSGIELRPFLKWAGGKRQLISQIKPYIPNEFNTYYEPFVGAGAILFDLAPNKAIVNDKNGELVNVYREIKNNLEELIRNLEIHLDKHSEEYYYEIRAKDRIESYNLWTDAQKAARFIYLNRTCYNGLYRVNSKGFFNVPFGKYKNPKIVDVELLSEVSRYLNENHIFILNGDFETALTSAKINDFVYIDPPYDPVSTTAAFTSYSNDGFNKEDQIRLKELFDNLNARGCKVLLSNSNTEFINDLYKDYKIELVTAARNINSVASKRGKVYEVLVMNY